MASTNGGPENEPLGRQELPGKQELITMLTVRDQILRAAEPKAAMGNLDDADTPEVIRVEVAFALRNFPELREELDAQQALLQKLLEVDRAARQRKRNEEVTDEQADEAGEQIAFSGHRDDVSEHSNLDPESAEGWAATSGDDEAAPPLANEESQEPEFQYPAQWSRWRGHGHETYVEYEGHRYDILDPAIYGGDETHNLGLCAKAWSFEPGVTCPKDWMNCPLRHWMFEPDWEDWVCLNFLTRAKLELPLPMGPPDHPLVQYEGFARYSFYSRRFRSSREGFEPRVWNEWMDYDEPQEDRTHSWNPSSYYSAQWSRWADYGARDHVVVYNVIYPILDPKLYGGNELHNLGLCAKAWSSEPGVSCPEDWTTCPLRHWQIELLEDWVDATFLRRSLELNLPVHCPDHPDVSYEGRARLSWDLRVFRSSR